MKERTITIKMLIEQGFAVRGVNVRLPGMSFAWEVSHVTDLGVYLIGVSGVFDPSSLIVVG